LPQIENKRVFKYEEGVAGLRLILWGMFKKVVVADTCAIYANDIFANYTEYSGPTLMLGAVYFAFQIYGDFSGYSDIAIGTAKLFGIQLMTNFKTPYFSRDIAEFWRRWHISLSTWFRDYLYIPLGGSRVGKWKAVRNVFIIFLVSGFWHGANRTFIVWGGIHAALFLPLLLRGKNRRYTSDTIGEGRWLPTGRELLGMAWTFTMVCVAWVFFRAESVEEAAGYLVQTLSLPSNTGQSINELVRIRWGSGSLKSLENLVLIAFPFIEWTKELVQLKSEPTGVALKAVKWAWMAVLVVLIIQFGISHQVETFIYFQF
jgi:D-alanyl-lipoteichoic acid acyltransferase DltB (MBOAT superfamily)